MVKWNLVIEFMINVYVPHIFHIFSKIILKFYPEVKSPNKAVEIQYSKKSCGPSCEPCDIKKHFYYQSYKISIQGGIQKGLIHTKETSTRLVSH